MLVLLFVSFLVNGIGGGLSASVTAYTEPGTAYTRLGVPIIPFLALVGLNEIQLGIVQAFEVHRSELMWFGAIVYVVVWVATHRHIKVSATDPVSEGAG